MSDTLSVLPEKAAENLGAKASSCRETEGLTRTASFPGEDGCCYRGFARLDAR